MSSQYFTLILKLQAQAVMYFEIILTFVCGHTLDIA